MIGDQRFSAMSLAHDVCLIHAVGTGCNPDTSVDTCTKQWRHWCGRGATDWLCPFIQTDNQYVHCFEEFEYECRLVDSTRRLGESPSWDWSKDSGEAAGFSRPQDQLYFFGNCCFWLHEVDPGISCAAMSEALWRAITTWRCLKYPC